MQAGQCPGRDSGRTRTGERQALPSSGCPCCCSRLRSPAGPTSPRTAELAASAAHTRPPQPGKRAGTRHASPSQHVSVPDPERTLGVLGAEAAQQTGGLTSPPGPHPRALPTATTPACACRHPRTPPAQPSAHTGRPRNCRGCSEQDTERPAPVCPHETHGGRPRLGGEASHGPR